MPASFSANKQLERCEKKGLTGVLQGEGQTKG